MKKRKIFFDLDGTLIDSSIRMYHLFCLLSKNCKMSYDEYWNIKRQGVSQKQLLMKYFNYPESECEIFHNKWMNNIENDDLLLFDKPFNDAIEILTNVFDNNDLFVVTARQKKENTRSQLKKLQIDKFFQDILITEQKINKYLIIKNNVFNINSNDIIIGDTKEDIETGIKLGIKKFAVTTGMLSYERLKTYNPDKIYKNLTELYFEIC